MISMQWLARNWVLGFSVISFICVTSYLAFSISLVKSARKVNYDVGVSAMIPFINIVVFIRKNIIVKRLAKVQVGEEEYIEI